MNRRPAVYRWKVLARYVVGGALYVHRFESRTQAREWCQVMRRTVGPYVEKLVLSAPRRIPHRRRA